MAQKEAGRKKEKSKKQKILPNSKCCNAYQEELLESVHMFGHCPVCNWAVADHDHYVPHGMYCYYYYCTLIIMLH